MTTLSPTDNANLLQCNEVLSFLSLQKANLVILVTLVVTFISRVRVRTGGRFPCSTKGLLVDTLLSLCPTNTCTPPCATIILSIFLSYPVLEGWSRCIAESNIFCARVLWTEILALNWIRCRRSNSKTMKRENSEAKPLLKFLSQDQPIS